MKDDIVILAKAVLELRYVIEQMQETGFPFYLEEDLERIIQKEED